MSTQNDNNEVDKSGFVIPKEKIGLFSKFKRQVIESFDAAKLTSEIKALLPPQIPYAALNAQFLTIHRNIACAHNPSHALAFIRDMLYVAKHYDTEGAVFVEAGCFKGGSTSKFSIVADILQRPLYVFDSFEGLPGNTEEHTTSVMGHSIDGWFQGGNFSGALDEVKHNVERFGKPSACKYIKGWFSETMPGFPCKVAAAFCDVDLASSTRTCLQYLYPALIPGGIICSQDGDFPLVIELFKDNSFWDEEMKEHPRPIIEGLGQKITRIIKPQ